MGIFGAFFWALVLWGIIVGLLLIISAMKYKKEKGWATADLIFSILGLITFQGLIIGPVLGIIGSAMAMSEKSKRR